MSAEAGAGDPVPVIIGLAFGGMAGVARGFDPGLGVAGSAAAPGCAPAPEKDSFKRTKPSGMKIAGRLYFAWIYPSAFRSSAISTAPPAAPRRVLCDRPTNL